MTVNEPFFDKLFEQDLEISDLALLQRIKPIVKEHYRDLEFEDFEERIVKILKKKHADICDKVKTGEVDKCIKLNDEFEDVAYKTSQMVLYLMYVHNPDAPSDGWGY